MGNSPVSFCKQFDAFRHAFNNISQTMPFMEQPGKPENRR
jgi:hypothetical protein